LLPQGLHPEDAIIAQRQLLNEHIAERGLSGYISWYYTPMALPFTSHLEPSVVVYDCMDELSAFQGAPPEMLPLEQDLFALADVVFAGGRRLYESKRLQHPNVHLFPSSIDKTHFARAREPMPDFSDQEMIPHPRVGFYGVLDERLDTDLLMQLAALRPDWHFILLGPIVKIREEDLPRSSNLHYLGGKSYADLPQYLANWDVATLPFARNASTQFISPTKTPEYLAAGKPVVSTAIEDVVHPYGDMGLVRIGSTAQQFAEAIEASLGPRDPAHDRRVDEFLAGMSWSKTFSGMLKEISKCGSASTSSSVLTGPPGECGGDGSKCLTT
jgi:UDP-galactopyranose mutase